MFNCKYCEKTITNKFNLSKHIQICKRKEIFEIRQYLESQLNEQQKYYEEKLDQQQMQYEKQIEKLEQQLTEFKTQIFEIAKQPKQILNNNNSNNTNTTHNNQKTLNIVNQLAPYDLSIEMVQETLEKYALEKIFKDGPTSIADFVIEKILTDTTTQKPKLIATDRSRGVFKYKDAEGNVHIDNKLTKTTDILQKPLFKANDQILLDILRRHNYDIDDFTRNTFSENTDLLNCINKEKLSAKLCRRLEGEYIPSEHIS
jgi:hypothetical protein